MAFPSSVPSYTGFTSTHTLSQDQHAAQHNAEQADIVALAQKLGTGASTSLINTVLRGNGAGTTVYDQLHLATDVSGVLGAANGGTGQNSLSSLPLISPNITGGGSWTGGPTLSGPNISDFTNANHNHSGPSGGGSLGNGIVSYTNLLSTIFSSQLQSQANTGSGGGTMYYINLGGIKLLWGVTANISQANATQVNYALTLPNGFFTTTQAVFPALYGPSNTSYFTLAILTQGPTSINLNLTNQTSSTLTTGGISFLVIGT